MTQYLDIITVTVLDIIHRPVIYSGHTVSENGFCLRLQVEPTQFYLIDYSCSLSPVRKQFLSNDGDRIQSPKCYTLNKRQDDG
jgi:hypothetical protein